MLQTLGHLPIGWLLIAPLAAAGFFAFSYGRTEVAALPIGSTIGARLNSQPNFHGYFLAFCTILPAALVFLGYLVFAESFIRQTLQAELPVYLINSGAEQVNLFVDRVARYVQGGSTDATGNILFDASVDRYAILKGQTRLLALAIAILAGLGGFFIGRKPLSRSFPARHYVEQTITALLF
ncbi:MAG: phosphate ABC transporter permease family protein, partial [Pseudomonadota bacterium]|nr:phosphate ABC transporter permease family protein [Pseudomonadota bacterium]